MYALNHPYTYADRYITLDVPITSLPKNLTLDDTVYDVKPEFHCSLLAVKKIIPLVVERDAVSEAEAEMIVTQAAFQIVNEVNPTISSIGPEFRIADQPERNRRTIVVMTKVDGLEEFFNGLNNSLKLDVPAQPTHITLFALGGLPIGITRSQELEQWTRPLTEGETHQLSRQINLGQVVGAVS